MKDIKKLTLSIIIPVYNEEKTISKVLDSLSKATFPSTTFDCFIVDDGSSDGTVNQVKTWIKDKKGYTLLCHQSNKGKGEAIHTGISHAKGEYILIQDADMEYDPNDIKTLLEPVLRGDSEVVYGTRLKRLPDFRKDERTTTFFLHYLGNRFLSLMTSVLYGQWVTDMETGYKLFPNKSLHNVALRAKRFDFEPEITAKLLKKGYTIKEVPISTNPRDETEGKKLIAIKDGPIAFWTLLKYRFID